MGLVSMNTRAAALLCSIPLVGCGAGAADSGGKTSEDEALAEELWAQLDGYTAWGRFDGLSDTPVLSDDHSGNYVLSFYDDAMLSWALSGAAPDGATAVKEVYAAEGDATPSGLTVMHKMEGYDPDGGDWFWAWYRMDGTVEAAGAVSMCSGCHSAAATDYVFAE